MKYLENAPFKGTFEGINSKTTDSVVCLYHNDDFDKDFALKWNKVHIGSKKDANRIAQFKKKSYELFVETLGEEYIIPSSFVVGSKKDNRVEKFKIYTVQPYIESWTGVSIPDEVRVDPVVQQQWDELGDRLLSLYNTAHEINSQLPAEAVFPISITLGSSRMLAKLGSRNPTLPPTPNIIVDKSTLRIGICDLGEYVPWNDNMQIGYDQIREAISPTDQTLQVA